MQESQIRSLTIIVGTAYKDNIKQKTKDSKNIFSTESEYLRAYSQLYAAYILVLLCFTSLFFSFFVGS